MRILAIETSCDETAGAVVEDGVREVCSVVASSKEFHVETGGIVPEVASRKQLEFIFPVISETLDKLCKSENYRNTDDAVKNIDALAVTVGPGLIGSLVVGVSAAKALALAWEKPLIPVNHLVGHIYANFIESPVHGARGSAVNLPAVCLLVSGGHTDLVLMKDHGDFEYLGGTLDDAAGECFDKVARMLGISKYLGGSVLSAEAAKYPQERPFILFPRPMIDQDNFDFSFSGLKTAVKRYVEQGVNDIPLVCREFEEAVVSVLVTKTMRAVDKYGVKTVLLGGGVSANLRLREKFKKEAEKRKISLFVPPLNLCTDNAVYIASAAFFNRSHKTLVEIFADPSLGIMDTV